jgi:uncharacterized protein HemX
MGPFEMVIVIVLIGTGAGIFKTYLQHKENISKKQSKLDTEELCARCEDQEKVIRNLTKRIEVLESIVIQDEFELNRKFKDLE